MLQFACLVASIEWEYSRHDFTWNTNDSEVLAESSCFPWSLFPSQNPCPFLSKIIQQRNAVSKNILKRFHRVERISQSNRGTFSSLSQMFIRIRTELPENGWPWCFREEFQTRNKCILFVLLARGLFTQQPLHAYDSFTVLNAFMFIVYVYRGGGKNVCQQSSK